jgi:hypothetical protein
MVTIFTLNSPTICSSGIRIVYSYGISTGTGWASGADHINVGSSSTWSGYASNGKYKYQYTGAVSSGDDRVCSGKADKNNLWLYQ